MIGTRLDNTYEVIGKLGEGGMGVVYEAQHAQTRRRVAIKVILKAGAADETLVARFQREARAAGAIDSRHIAQVLDAGADPESGAPYLVMELLKGNDVDQLMKRFGTLRPTLALRIVAQALAGLDRAHAAKVIHRDIKPANLFVTEGEGSERVVKLVDFGVAKIKDDVTASREYSLTQTSSLLGSPLYMSPEQARTSKSVDGRADIWSLGTVLYQLLSGEAPHHHATSLTELLLAICTEPAAPIQTRAPWVPPDIAAVVMKALEIEAGKRYATAAAMLEDITAIIPDWNHLDASMFTPMTDEERDFVAQRAPEPVDLHVSTGPNSTKTISQQNIPAAFPTAPAELSGTRVDSIQPRDLIESAPGSRALSVPGLPTRPEDEPAPPTAKSRLGYVVGGGIVVALVCVFAVARGTSSARPLPTTGIIEMPKPAEPPTASIMIVETPTPIPSAEPPPTASAAPKPKTAPGPKVLIAQPPVPKPTVQTASPPSPMPKPPPSSISRDFN